MKTTADELKAFVQQQPTISDAAKQAFTSIDEESLDVDIEFATSRLPSLFADAGGDQNKQMFQLATFLAPKTVDTLDGVTWYHIAELVEAPFIVTSDMVEDVAHEQVIDEVEELPMTATMFELNAAFFNKVTYYFERNGVDYTMGKSVDLRTLTMPMKYLNGNLESHEYDEAQVWIKNHIDNPDFYTCLRQINL